MTDTKTQQLGLLQAAVGLLPAAEIARRTREILDGAPRADKAAGKRSVQLVKSVHEIKDASDRVVATLTVPERIDLVRYLKARGWSGWRLAKLIVEFGREVAMEYVHTHGDYPSKGDDRQYQYAGFDDLALIDRVYDTRIQDVQREVFGYVLDREFAS